MPSTPTYALPYPADNDPADIPIDMQELAERVEAIILARQLADAKGDLIAASAPDTFGRLPVGTNGQVLTADAAATLGVKWAAAAAGGGATIGTTLPASPTDGQEAILVDSLTAPTYAWHMRYVASITDTKKWVYVGGLPARAFVFAAETTTTVATWVNVATVGPTFAVPRAGDYIVTGELLCYKTGPDILTGAGVNVGDFSSPNLSIHGSHYTASAYQSLNASIRFLDVAAAAVLRMKYYQSAAGTLTVNQRQITVHPARIA